MEAAVWGSLTPALVKWSGWCGATPVNIKDYGAKCDGSTDDHAAVRTALQVAVSQQRPLYFPPGVTRVGQPIALSGITGLTCLGDAGKSIITGGSHTITGATARGRTAQTSKGIFQVSQCHQIEFRDLLFDGGLSNGFAYYGANYTDQQALLEFRTSTAIRLDACIFTRFIPAIPVESAGGRIHPDPFERRNYGPVFVNSCDGVNVIRCQILTPSYGEGLCVMQSTHLTIDGLKTTAGSDTDPVYGMSSPMNINGPLCQYVTITNCNFYKHRGSCINLGGAGHFTITNNTSSYGEGIDCSIENTELLFPDSPDTESIVISGNTIRDALSGGGSIGISVGGANDGSEKFKHVQITNNVIDGSVVGIAVAGCEDVQILNNKLTRIFQFAPAANYGDGISVQNVTNLRIEGNSVDGGTRVNGKRMTLGIFVGDCEDVDVGTNVVNDAQQTNLFVTLTDAYDLPFTNGTTALTGVGHGVYTVKGEASGATLRVIGRRITGGSAGAGTMSGVIRGQRKTGTFQPGESLSIDGQHTIAQVVRDATLIDRMNRVDVHDNRSLTATTTAKPVVIGALGINRMRQAVREANNQHNGATARIAKP